VRARRRGNAGTGTGEATVAQQDGRASPRTREMDAGRPPTFSDAEFARRYQAVRAVMAADGLDALLLYGTPGQDHEVHYLANVRVTREALLLFPVTGEPALYVQYYNHVSNARRRAYRCDVRWGGDDSAVTVARDVRERGLGGARIGYAGMLPVQRYLALRRELPQATLLDVTPQLRQLRLVKSAEELAYLRRGAALSDRAMHALAREARPGLTEHQLAAIIEGAYVGEGGQTGIHYFATTPMDQPDVAVPAQQQSDRRLAAGDVLITEISAQYEGYPGQILRPFAVGAPPTPAYARMYDVAVAVFERIAGCLRAGATTEDVLDAAEGIAAAGYTICDDLLHGLGGGYLPPVLRTRQTGTSPNPPVTFVEDMTVVIQPNVTTMDQRSGVQVGELVRITGSGIERLHDFPMRFTRCG